MFIFSILLFVVAIIFAIVALAGMRWGWFAAVGSALVGILLLIFSMSYSVDQGQAKVLKDWTGVIQGEPVSEPGLHWKAPWVDVNEYDTRNQIVVYLGDGHQQYNGSDTDGPQITFTDKDGVTGNMDLVVVYSIDPKETKTLAQQYSSQEDFNTKVIQQDARSIPRNIPGKYTTIQMLTERGKVAGDIQKALENNWADKGVHVDNVSLQEVRYSDAVKKRFEDAQNAQTEIVKAQAELEKAKIDAQQTVAKAQAQKDANDLLAASLTPAILQQHYIDMLTNAKTIVVPNNFNALGNLAQ